MEGLLPIIRRKRRPLMADERPKVESERRVPETKTVSVEAWEATKKPNENAVAESSE